jgi:Methyltransferase domain
MIGVGGPMLETNVDLLLRTIRPEDLVLDVGGWYRPFTRADHVVDLMPYRTRGQGGTQGPLPERFGPDTWVQADFGGGDRLPFEDQRFDFVICSHTLEDIRDPVGLVRELSRVGKAGYVETPSALAELTFGIESRRYAGWYHHRWLVQMQPNRIEFRHKPAFVHGDRRFHLPKRMSRTLTPAERVSWLIWEGGLEANEIMDLDMDSVKRDIEDMVRRTGVYPPAMYRIAPYADAAGRLRNSASSAVRRTLSRR